MKPLTEPSHGGRRVCVAGAGDGAGTMVGRKPMERRPTRAEGPWGGYPGNGGSTAGGTAGEWLGPRQRQLDGLDRSQRLGQWLRNGYGGPWGGYPAVIRRWPWSSGGAPGAATPAAPPGRLPCGAPWGGYPGGAPGGGYPGGGSWGGYPGPAYAAGGPWRGW